MGTLFKVKKTLAKAMEWICVVIAATLTVSTVLAVILRYIFSKTFIQQEELGSFLFVTLVFLGTVPVTFAREHVSVTILQQNMPPAVQKIMRILQLVIVFAVQVLLIYASRIWISTNMKFLTPGLRIPYWTIYTVLPFSCALNGIIVLIDFVEEITGKSGKEGTK